MLLQQHELCMNTKLDAEKIAIQSLEIAAELCIYTNNNITLEKIK